MYLDVDIALPEVPVNICQLIDDTTFKDIESAIVYNQAGLVLVWNFLDTAGNMSQTAVTPSNSGDYLWTNQGNGIYSLQIPATGGASINNNTEGMGWFSGVATGVLPWIGPRFVFRSAALNNALVDGTSNLETNVKFWDDSAVSKSAGEFPNVNILRLGDSEQSATDLKDFADAGYDPANNRINEVNIVNNVIGEVQADVAKIGGSITPAGNLADMYDGTGYTANTAPATQLQVSTLTSSLTALAAKFTGITLLAKWLQALFRSDAADATAKTEINDGGGSYDEATESQQAIRDRGDAAWVTGGGGAISQIINLTYMIPNSIDLADTATVQLGLSIINSVDDLPSTAEINPGTISIERKPIGGTSWTAVVTDAACSESAGLIYYDEVFNAGSGYAEGDSIRITFKSQSVTADANTFEINGTVGTIKQTEIRQTMRGTDDLVSGSGESITPAISDSTVSTGSVAAGTYASTAGKDGVYWQIQDDVGAMEVIIWFNVGNTGIPRTIQMHGRLNSSNDVLTVWAYDRVAAAYIQVGVLNGTNLTTDTDHTYDIYNTMVEDGIVKFRLYAASGLSSANLYIDQIFCAYSVVQSSTGYEGGAVWLNTVLGYAGSVDDVNGVADYPSNNMADVNLLLASKNLNRVYVLAGSTVLLAASQQNQQFEGCNWILQLGGQVISGSRFSCASVSGIASAISEVIFDDSIFGAATVPPGRFSRCGFGYLSGAFTAAAAGEYAFINPYSLVPGSGTPSFIFNGLGGTTGINVRAHKGGSTWVLDSDCTLSLEVSEGGKQQITTGGADVEIRGTIRELNLILSGAGTVQFVGIVGVINISGTATTTVNLYGVAGEINDTSSGTTVNNKTVKYEDVNSILVDTNEIQGKLPIGDICDDDTPLADADVQAACDAAITANSSIGTISGKVSPLPADPASETNVTAVGSAVAGVQLDVTSVKAKTDNLPETFKKNVAFSNFPFMMVLASDSKSPGTGLTVTGQIMQDTGSFVSLTNSVVEVGNGVYRVNLTAAEMNANSITLRFSAATADDRVITIVTNT